MTLTSTNPATLQKLGSVKVSTQKEINLAVTQAHHAKATWQEYGINQRLKHLQKLHQVFSQNQDQIATLITKEIGKPIKESQTEVKRSLEYFQYYLDHAPGYLAPEIAFQNQDITNTLHYEPRGVAAVILPWNFPFMLFIWGVIPNLIAGNVVIAKPSELCPLVGKLLHQLTKSALLPDHIYQQIFGDGTQGEYLVHQDINLIWFTGSSAVGSKLSTIAGQKMIPAILEMGGSNPAIVFPDVDLPAVAQKIYQKRFTNCGQYCNAIKRVIVHRSIESGLVNQLQKIIASTKVGDPQDPKTQIGPMISATQRQQLIDQVQEAVNQGANIITGGHIPKNLPGYYYAPTLITNLKPHLRLWQEEVFGPVLPIINFTNEFQALKLANNTPYGLGAHIFTSDLDLAQKLAQQIESGMVDINQGSASHPTCPFGGIKNSGFGREHGPHGFQSLTQLKVISNPR